MILFCFFLLLELVSLSLYVLICFNFESVKAVEASLKYFVLGSIASIFYLYGVSFLYGFFGTTNFFQLSGLFYSFYFNGFLYKYFVFGCMGIVIGILFKLGLVPFHIWIIDVYKGLNFFSFFFFSIFTKLSFFFILIRLMFDVFFVFVYDLYMIFVYISIFSIVIGAVGALGSVSFRHVFTYTTISNSGFVLLGMLNFTGKALIASSFYLFGYVLLLLLLCGCLIMVNINKSNQFFESIEDFAYVRSLSPFVSYLLVGVFFSMAGLPPFLGFFMKFFLFLSFISFGSYFSFMITFFLLMINVLNVFVYIRLISYLIFDVEKYNGFFMNDKFVYLINVSISLLNVGVIILFFFLR